MNNEGAALHFHSARKFGVGADYLFGAVPPRHFHAHDGVQFRFFAVHVDGVFSERARKFAVGFVGEYQLYRACFKRP